MRGGREIARGVRTGRLLLYTGDANGVLRIWDLTRALDKVSSHRVYLYRTRINPNPPK